MSKSKSRKKAQLEKQINKLNRFLNTKHQRKLDTINHDQKVEFMQSNKHFKELFKLMELREEYLET